MIEEIIVRDSRDSGATQPGFAYRIRPNGSVWSIEMQPRDPAHWAAGPWDPMCSRPSLADAMATIERFQDPDWTWEREANMRSEGAPSAFEVNVQVFATVTMLDGRAIKVTVPRRVDNDFFIVIIDSEGNRLDDEGFTDGHGMSFPEDPDLLANNSRFRQLDGARAAFYADDFADVEWEFTDG